MKHFKTIILFSLLITALIFNWNCSDDNIPIGNNQNEKNINPTTGESIPQAVSLFVAEYVKVTPPEGKPYYGYLQTGIFTCNDPFVGSGNLCSSGFTTPASSRTESYGTVETQYYRITKYCLFKCADNNCMLKWRVGDILNYNPSASSIGGNCPDEYECAPGTFCGNYYDEDEPITLSPNTYYFVQYGGIRIVEDEDDN